MKAKGPHTKGGADREQALERFPQHCEDLARELGHVIVGQQEVVRHVLTAFFVGGHCLLQGVPGLAKTLLVRTLANALDLSFKRIQFTPDLMPMDILGADVLEEDRATGRREIRFLPGPVFANILLADEINRTPPKTQAALLEAMEEHQVTVGGQGYDLPEPFFVLATQNPIEQEGTYLLPEAQLDRFLFLVRMEYPDEEEERQILLRTTGGAEPRVSTVMTAEDVMLAQQVVRDVPVPPHVVDYAARLVRASRPGEPAAPEFVRRWVRWGAGPRAGQALILGGKARALMDGRFAVGPQDIRDVALPVLRHRILLNYHAEAEGQDPDTVATRLLDSVHLQGIRIGVVNTRPAADAGAGLLDPETLTRIGNLELVARRAVQGFLTGLHRSSMRGFSTEFDQFRPYAQGDDLKHVDWKIFARTDRYFVKEYEADRNVDTWVLLDASGSMGFRGSGIGKFRYAGMLAASLAYLLLRQRDRAGLWLAGGDVPGVLPVGCRPGQLQRFVSLLDSITPDGRADLAGEIETLMGRQGRSGLVVLISDLYDNAETLRRALVLLRQAGHEVLVFHLLDSQELEFPFQGPLEFVDLETGRSRAVDASQVREDYRDQMAGFLEQASDLCTDAGASYLRLDSASSLAAPLAAFLAARSGGQRPAIPWR